MQSLTFASRSARTARFNQNILKPRFFTPAAALRVRDEGQSPEEVEQKKHEQLKKQDKGEGEWHESLASSSETRVKADQEKVHDHDAHIEKLQKETAKSAEKEKS